MKAIKTFRTRTKPSRNAAVKGLQNVTKTSLTPSDAAGLANEPARLSSTESTDQSIPAPRTSKAVWRPTVIITRRIRIIRLCSCSADVLLTAISSGLIWIWGDSLTHALELKDATAIHVWMEESDGSGNGSHNSQQRRWQNQLWALWRENSGPVRAKGD